ncbi:hypothetical protein B296_00033555 [Ensete ventricosum]|uniref:Uncharacterized protein n=1 Tax=Ensete ventricosum TaxID=4639 RepID=A0A426Z920_ENSVE|nr:hypothetical protein B296_00033555 [Ensete ventricosum]
MNPLPAVAEDDDLEQGSPPGGHGGRVNRPKSEPPNTNGTEKEKRLCDCLALIGFRTVGGGATQARLPDGWDDVDIINRTHESAKPSTPPDPSFDSRRSDGNGSRTAAAPGKGALSKMHA